MAAKTATNSAQDAFVANLTRFDLTGLEAQCYYLLLHDGSMTISSLAKGLGIDTEGVHRVLAVREEYRTCLHTISYEVSSCRTQHCPQNGNAAP